MSRGFMYILECADGSFYTGSTKDIERRLMEHQGHLDTMTMSSLDDRKNDTMTMSSLDDRKNDTMTMSSLDDRKNNTMTMASRDDRGNDETYEERGANYTRKRRPVKLVYFEEYDRIDEAFYREKQVQGWSRKKKIALIDGKNEELPALAKKVFRPKVASIQSPLIIKSPTKVVEYSERSKECIETTGRAITQPPSCETK